LKSEIGLRKSECFLGDHEKHEIHERVKVEPPRGRGSFFSCEELAALLIISFSEAIASEIFVRGNLTANGRLRHADRREGLALNAQVNVVRLV